MACESYSKKCSGMRLEKEGVPRLEMIDFHLMFFTFFFSLFIYNFLASTNAGKGKYLGQNSELKPHTIFFLVLGSGTI